MLNPYASGVSPATPLKTHGSDNRLAYSTNGGQANEISTQAANQALVVGSEGDHALANVNAETATALNRTVLQTLALAVAARIGLARNPDETLEAFFIRLAGALEQKTQPQQGQIEARTVLRLMKITIAELTPALRDPDSPIAARLIAQAEAPGAAPQKTAAVSVTNSYLQSGAAPARAAETLAMSQNTKAPSDAAGLFANAALREDDRRQSPQMLQSQLRVLFMPDVPTMSAPAETAPPENTTVRQPETPPTVQTSQSRAGLPAAPQAPQAQIAAAATDNAPETDAKPAVSSIDDGLSARPNTPASAQASQGRAEIADRAAPRPMIGEASSKAAGDASVAKTPQMPVAGSATRDLEQALATAVMAEQVLDVLFPNDDHLKTTLFATGRSPQADTTLAAAQALFDASAADEGESLEQSLMKLLASETATPVHESDTPSRHAAKTGFSQAAADTKANTASTASETDAAPLHEPVARRSEATPSRPAAAVLQEMTTTLQQTAQTQMAAAYAYSTVPLAPERFVAAEPDEADERRNGDEQQDSGQGAQQEDAEARRERLAKAAVDRLLEPESDDDAEMIITRDSTEADRAFALYQKMGGF